MAARISWWWCGLVTFTLPGRQSAQLEMFDVAGRRRLVMDVADLRPGRHSIALARGGTPTNGIYMMELTQGARFATRKAVLLR